jgi:hypothetical protein
MKRGLKEGYNEIGSGRSLSIRKRKCESALIVNEQLKPGRVAQSSLLWEAAAVTSCKHRLTLAQI